MTRRIALLCLLLAAATTAFAHDSNGLSYVLKIGDTTRIVNVTTNEAVRFSEPGDFLWIELDGRGYMIRDRRVLDEATRVFRDFRALSDERREVKERHRELRLQYKQLDRERRNLERRAAREDREADTRELERKMEALEPKLAELDRERERLESRRDELRRIAERDFERLVREEIRSGRAEQRERP